jgi:phage terminase large subunit-like protein
VVAIDPAVTEKTQSAETGIIVAGLDDAGLGYVLEDISGRFSATQWIEKAVDAYHRYGADRIIAEVNNGGDMVRHLLHSLFPNISYQSVYATRSKHVRAEPIAALYEQKRVVHCGYFHELEQQMLSTHRSLADRMDALVWALHALFFNAPSNSRMTLI